MINESKKSKYLLQYWLERKNYFKGELMIGTLVVNDSPEHKDRIAKMVQACWTFNSKDTLP